MHFHGTTGVFSAGSLSKHTDVGASKSLSCGRVSGSARLFGTRSTGGCPSRAAPPPLLSLTFGRELVDEWRARLEERERLGVGERAEVCDRAALERARD